MQNRRVEAGVVYVEVKEGPMKKAINGWDREHELIWEYDRRGVAELVTRCPPLPESKPELVSR